MTTCNIASGYQNSSINTENVNCFWTSIRTDQADITVTNWTKTKRAVLNAWKEGERRMSLGRLFKKMEYWTLSILSGIGVLYLATSWDIGYVTLKCMVIDRLISWEGCRSERSQLYGIMRVVIFNFLTSVEHLRWNPNFRATPVNNGPRLSL